MSFMTITVRKPTSLDAAAIADLSGQLGYPATDSEIVERLSSIVRDESAVIYVAELGGRVAGVITSHMFPVIHATPRAAWITMLVVDKASRGQHVGQELVKRVEEWVIKNGAAKISVTSALKRADAHAFYEQLGYARSGMRLTKTF